MTTRISVSDNVDDVKASLDAVETDLKHEIRERVGAAMQAVHRDARVYIARDPDYEGGLFHSLQMDSDTSGREMSFTISTDAPYAAIVEFGSGERTNESYPGGNDVPNGWPDSSSTVPSGFPFSSPSMDTSMDNDSFAGFVAHIMEWMEQKPVPPRRANRYLSAISIAETIVEKGNYAHPFMRPAWFDNELQVRQAARNAVRNATR